ncbi:hypothetical protein QR680_018273 [Steinernema hermaphroditum]|uniref:Uncharacterized protein n=1 Tax=Steinernema hermaphroditum TaxID=289476 RepID=A0AA39HJJ5_9BILA|nr:hypothetical protein QR680_018273 [Steinernema hermaphroditum]
MYSRSVLNGSKGPNSKDRPDSATRAVRTAHVGVSTRKPCQTFLAALTTSLLSEVRASKCLATLGAVEYNFSSPAWPTGGREIDCHFNLNVACYAFVPASQPDSVEYGCEKRRKMDRSALKRRNITEILGSSVAARIRCATCPQAWKSCSRLLVLQLQLNSSAATPTILKYL